MPYWPSFNKSATDRAAELHEKETGAPARVIGRAPGTWMMVGDHTDPVGGLIVGGLVDLDAAVAVSRTSGKTLDITLSLVGNDGEPQIIRDQVNYSELDHLHRVQTTITDEEGTRIIPPQPTGGWAIAVSGVVWTLINRQVISRDTAGLKLTVVCDIPADAGAGARAAVEAATAIAMTALSDGDDDAPARARMAEICSQSAAWFTAAAPLKSRHTLSLRGAMGQCSLIDYADGSVNSCPYPGEGQLRALLVIPPTVATPKDSVCLFARRRFFAEASRAYGTDVLRLLPDFRERVLQWVDAMHRVRGRNSAPISADASKWLSFTETDITQAARFVAGIRSRSINQTLGSVAVSTKAIEDLYGFEGAAPLTELCLHSGALAARPADAFTATTVTAWVDANDCDDIEQKLSETGLTVLQLLPSTAEAASSYFVSR